LKRVLAEIKESFRRANTDIKKAYDTADVEKKGHIEFKEFADIVRSVDEKFPSEDYRLIFEKLDTTGAGQCKKSEFLREFYVPEAFEEKHVKYLIKQIRDKMKLKSKEEINSLYNLVDKNHNKKVSMEEFEEFLHAVIPGITRDEPYAVFRVFDKDGSGVISFNEF
jgi:Ca2+-binding EF-hand superfamily protein